MAHNTEKLRELLQALRTLANQLDAGCIGDSEYDDGFYSGQEAAARDIRGLISQAEGEAQHGS